MDKRTKEIIGTTALIILFVVLIGVFSCSKRNTEIVNENSAATTTTADGLIVYDMEMNHCNGVGFLTRADMAQEFTSAFNLFCGYSTNDCSISEIANSFNYGDSTLDDFIGDSVTGYAMPSAVTIALGNCLSLHNLGKSYIAENVTGTPWDSIVSRVNAGIPMMVWVTENLEEPQDVTTVENSETYYSNRRIVVIYAINNEGVHVSDPIDGDVTYDTSKFENAYETCGQKAIMIRRTVA